MNKNIKYVKVDKTLSDFINQQSINKKDIRNKDNNKNNIKESVDITNFKSLLDDEQPVAGGTRLTNDGYKRPVITITDKLTVEQVEEKLEDYVEIKSKDWDKVKIGCHIAYFSLVDGKKKFRPGGFLRSKKNISTYIILSNGRRSWSVQTEGTTFYRKLSYDEIKKEFEGIIRTIEIEKEELSDKVKELEQLNKDLIEYIRILRKKLKN